MIGVLQNTPQVFDPCDIGISGVTKAVAGAAITFGTELMVSGGAASVAGSFIPWVAGAGNYKVGVAYETAASAGILFSMLIYNPNVRFTTL
jgi:hypothetical protein